MNLEIKITKREIKVAIALTFFSLLVFFAFKTIFLFNSQYEEELLLSQENSSQVTLVDNKIFDDLSLSAKSYFVWDIQAGKKLGGSNEEIQLPLASLAKLMTVLVASELSTNGTKIIIKPDDLETEGDNGLIAGEEWKFSDLLDFMLVTSSNDGAQAVASIIGAFKEIPDGVTGREAFVNVMNAKAKDLEMSQTFFLNETGLDVNESVSGAYGSAKDISILIDKILRDYPNILGASSRNQTEISSNLFTHQINNTNQTVETLPSVIASKTGFTDLAGGNLAIVFDAGINRKIIVSVLGSTKEERFTDVEKLVWAALEKIFNNNQKI
jgi:serine-type D-Ala-D-Ala carboxypeptidase (penicillin-binding protein 5/6)